MIIGEISSGMISPRQGKLGRLRPIAANVPSVVARRVEAKPIPRLFKNARCHCGSLSAASYQRSDTPVIG
ncbi:hypothetical protein D3C81_2003270 [compost metagenome]